MARRIIYHVTKTNGYWQAKKPGNKIPTVAAPTKKELVEDIIYLASCHARSSVIIHKANGEIQEERPYPRASDPRRTKG